MLPPSSSLPSLPNPSSEGLGEGAGAGAGAGSTAASASAAAAASAAAGSGALGTAPSGPTPRGVRPPRLVWLLLRWLFDGGMTPGILVRGLGPLSFPCVACSFRFRAARWILERAWTPEDHADLLHYMFHTTAAHGVGEHALNKLLAPGAYARQPLLPRLREAVGSLKAAGCARTPISWLYGGHYDWMSPTEMRAAAAVLREAGFAHAKVYSVPRSGHHLYLENPGCTNEIILQELGKIVQ